MSSGLDAAIAEIQRCKAECLALLDDLQAFCVPDEHGRYPDTFRLLATPMFYSAWERCFTLCQSVVLRLVRDQTQTPYLLKGEERAIWLIGTAFFASLTAKLQNGTGQDTATVGRGRFAAACEFLKHYDVWASSPFDGTASVDDLVMTFSNVNPAVVEANATAVGMIAHPDFAKLKLGRLHDLVGRRNEIGHGAVIRPPDNEIFCDLRDFTRQIIGDYSDMVCGWLRSRYLQEPSEAPAAEYMIV